MKKSNPNYGENTPVQKINEESVKVLTGLDIVKSMESGMNPATDNEKSKKQINKALY